MTRQSAPGSVGMMTKKRLALIAVLPLTVAVILGALAMLPPPPGVTKANFDRIQDGMTKAEVEEIFGTGPASGWRGTEVEGETWGWWEGEDEPGAEISFNDERVSRRLWFSDPKMETVLARVRRWLHLPKGN